MANDPIEAQLKERLKLIEAGERNPEGFASNLARECAALRRLCRDAYECGFDETKYRLRAAGEGEEIQ